MQAAVNVSSKIPLITLSNYGWRLGMSGNYVPTKGCVGRRRSRRRRPWRRKRRRMYGVRGANSVFVEGYAGGRELD